MSDFTPVVEPYEGPAGRSGFLVRTPYSEGFVSELKTLPKRDRWWNLDESAAWWIAEEQIAKVGDWLVFYFGSFERVDAETGAIDIVTSRGVVARQERLL